MITPRPDLKVVLATQPIDFRKGVHGLVALVAEALKADPYWATSSSSAPSARTGLNFCSGTAAD